MMSRRNRIIPFTIGLVVVVVASSAQAVVLYEENWESYPDGKAIDDPNAPSPGYTLGIGTGPAGQFRVTDDGLFGVGTKAAQIIDEGYEYRFYDKTLPVAPDMTGAAGNFIIFEADVYYDAELSEDDFFYGFGPAGTSSAYGVMANWNGGPGRWLWAADPGTWGVTWPPDGTEKPVLTGVSHVNTTIDLAASQITYKVTDAAGTSTNTVDLADASTIDINTFLMGSYNGGATLIAMDNILVQQLAELPPECGDANHPPPAMDFDGDCYVGLTDFALFAATYGDCTDPNSPCDFSP